MEKDKAEYVTRDFSAVDQHVDELAKRERILTWRLFIDNLKRLGLPLILIACALAILLIALGVFIWIIKQEKIKEIDKIVRVPKVEIERVIEQVKVDKVVEVPKYFPLYLNIADPALFEKIKNILLQGDGKITEKKLREIQQLIQSQTSQSLKRQPSVQPSVTTGENMSAPNEDEIKSTSRIAKERLRNNNVNIKGKALSFLLKWENINDLDIHVQRPDRKIINYSIPYLPGKFGGRLDVDKNVSNYTRQPIENINFGEAMAGEYGVGVSIHNDRTSNRSGQTNFEILVYEDGILKRVHSDKISHRITQKNSLKKILTYTHNTSSSGMDIQN